MKLQVQSSIRALAAGAIHESHPELSEEAARMVADYCADLFLSEAEVVPEDNSWGVRSVRYPVYGIEREPQPDMSLVGRLDRKDGAW